MLQGGMGGQDGVVGLHHGGGHLGGGVDGKLQLGLLAVVHGQPLHQQGREPRAGAATEGVEEEEALEAGALVSQLTDAVQDEVHDFLADGVVAPGVVVGGVLLAVDQLLGVVESLVGAHAGLVNDGGLEVHEDGPGHLLAAAGLGEEGLEGVVSEALSEGMQPSGWMPCSRQYSSQQALPIWTPAWPMWTEMHSRMMIGRCEPHENIKGIRAALAQN